MIAERPTIERRVLAVLDASPARIPVLLGGCGTGRTTILQRIAHLLGEGGTQYIDAERVATTPEGFLRAITGASPFVDTGQPRGGATSSARDAFDHALAFCRHAHGPDHRPATFLIDEVLELRTFESFPGLRNVLRELLATLTDTRNRFVLTARYVNRALRLLREAPGQFEVIHIPPLAASEVVTSLAAWKVGRSDGERADLGRVVHALADGRPVYVRLLAEALAALRDGGASDPVAALAAQMAAGAPLAVVCRFSYELRLHRARGYGALKAILQVLAEEEPLTLTEIAQRLRRTPGSTKDYLSWLEDVDLITARQKRYSFGDPVLRLWVRLHGRSMPPSDSDLAREVQEYALGRLPFVEPALVLVDAPARRAEQADANASKAWSIVEID